MWKDDCWIFGVDITEETVRRWFGPERNVGMHLVVTADAELKEPGVSGVLRGLADDPSTDPVFEHNEEKVIVYNNLSLSTEIVSASLRKIIRLLGSK